MSKAPPPDIDASKPRQAAAGRGDYMPQLDALRGLAVLAVLVHHWLPCLLVVALWGKLGVRCFFVLSGFLITGILLRARESVVSGRSTFGQELRQFFIRRVLRIFPIYYLTLLGGVLVGMAVLKQSFWWHFFFCSNFYLSHINDWHGYVSHLWSLSVEEQFYLLWPAIVFLTPPRFFPWLIGVIFISGMVTRLILSMAWGAASIGVEVLLPCCVDSLAAGAFLAWFSQRGGAERCAALGRRILPWGAVGLLVAGGLRMADLVEPARAVVGPAIESVFFACVIAMCATGVGGISGWFLNTRPLQYVGRISYGLYLYHLFVPYGLGMILARFPDVKMPENQWLQFLIYSAISIGIAAFSSRWIERPINGLKRFFPSGGGGRSPATVQSGRTV